jgi:hypothetical protein
VQTAAGEKNRSGAARAADAGLFSVVRGGTDHAGQQRAPADPAGLRLGPQGPAAPRAVITQQIHNSSQKTEKTPMGKLTKFGSSSQELYSRFVHNARIEKKYKKTVVFSKIYAKIPMKRIQFLLSAFPRRERAVKRFCL